MKNCHQSSSELRIDVFKGKPNRSYELLEKNALKRLSELLKHIEKIPTSPKFQNLFHPKEKRIEYKLMVYRQDYDFEIWIIVTFEKGQVLKADFEFLKDRYRYVKEILGENRDKLVNWMAPYFEVLEN